MTVDLYGQSADYDALLAAVRAGTASPLVEDAAEALGATYRGRPAGSFGAAGGLLLQRQQDHHHQRRRHAGDRRRAELVDRARFLATQARDPFPHYEHSVLGYNYRLSNLLAALGRAQLARPGQPDRPAPRPSTPPTGPALADIPGIEFMPVADYGEPNYWLTCITVDPDAVRRRPRDRSAWPSRRDDIESRPTWKPLHLQPVFDGAPHGGRRGLRHRLRTGPVPAHRFGAHRRRAGTGDRDAPVGPVVSRPHGTAR